MSEKGSVRYNQQFVFVIFDHKGILLSCITSFSTFVFSSRLLLQMFEPQ